MTWAPSRTREREPTRRWIVLGVGATVACSAILAVVVFALHNVDDRNDFLYELWPSYVALHTGHLGAAVNSAPGYVGAALWRAPFALIALACGAGWRITFLVTAVPCYAVAVMLGAWVAVRLGRGAGETHRIAVGLGLVLVLDPVVWYAGLLGHPEELVGIMFALAAVLLAVDGRGALALACVILAVLNKPGLAEVIPVVLAVTRGRHAQRALGVCLAATVMWALYNLTPLVTAIPITHLSTGALTTGDFFPFQLLWWLGRGSWLVTHEHVLLVPVCVLLTWVWSDRQRRVPERSPGERQQDALWLMALMLLFRTAVEPWNNVYYNLPLILCLVCIESGRIPVLTVAASVGALALVPTNRIIALSADGQAALYAVIVVPVLLGMARRVYRPAGPVSALVAPSKSRSGG